MRWSRPGWCWRPAAMPAQVFDAVAPAAAGARAAGARGDHAARRAGLCRLCPHARCAWTRRLRRCARMWQGRLIAVFGAGGDRDTGKRAPMGEVAARAGRSGHRHRRQSARRRPGARSAPTVLAGAAPSAREIGDRREAIAAAIAEAGADDIVLIAGKGHEQGQIVGVGREDARLAVRRCDGCARMRRAAEEQRMMSARSTQLLRLAAAARSTAARWRCGPRPRSPHATGGTASGDFPGCRRRNGFAATCGRATCSSRSRARRWTATGSSTRPLPTARLPRWSIARSTDPHVLVADTTRRSNAWRMRRASARGAKMHRGHRIGRQDRGEGSDLRRARPRQPRRGAPFGAQLQQPCRRAAQPRAHARAQPIRRVRNGHEPRRRDRRADRAGPPACRA